jgi:hypothetical protein
MRVAYSLRAKPLDFVEPRINMHDPHALFTLSGAVRRDPAVEFWWDVLDPMRAMVRPWFEYIRSQGEDVRECLHDHMPTACVETAAFAYVNAFNAHAAIGFFHGSALPDPQRLLEGTGKRMRHVKLKPDMELDENALRSLIEAAHADARSRIAAASPS